MAAASTFRLKVEPVMRTIDGGVCVADKSGSVSTTLAHSGNLVAVWVVVVSTLKIHSAVRSFSGVRPFMRKTFGRTCCAVAIFPYARLWLGSPHRNRGRSVLQIAVDRQA